MRVKCRHCNHYFEVAEPVKPSIAEKVEMSVTCAECYKENQILWPRDLAPLPRKCQEG